MASVERRAPLQLGETAPDFTVPAVHREGTVSLAEYRGKSPVFLALFRGLWCPFCRRAIAQLGITQEKLRAVGVETLGIVATKAENARLYFKFHPANLALGADPELTTHRAYGVPKPQVTPNLVQALQSVRINPTGELREPLPPPEASKALDQLDRFQPTPTDREDAERQFPQLEGRFLLDREGIVRWVYVECAKEGLAGVGKFPTDEELLTAARSLAN